MAGVCRWAFGVAVIAVACDSGGSSDGQPTTVATDASSDTAVEVLFPDVPPITEVEPDTIEAAHVQGLEIVAYTVNEIERAHALRAAGVASLITDMPERLLPALA